MRTAGPTTTVLIVSFIALLAAGAGAKSHSWKADGVYTLPTIPLGDFLFDEAGISAASDHGIMLGGIGSDLWRAPEDGAGIYWQLTDRGANGLFGSQRTFPIPEFTPFILQVRTTDGRIDILRAIPITGVNGEPVTGLSNAARDEVPWKCDVSATLTPNPHGLDSEGLARAHDGTFWIAEEYSPSLLHIDTNGQVLKRYVPAGLPADTATTLYPSEGVLPAIFGKRKINRGFEGLTLSPNQRTVYVALQSPLSNPNGAEGNKSSNTRILAFDARSETVVGEYVYRFQPSTEFPAPENRPQDLKVSALAMLDQHRMLVLERVDALARIFLVDLRKATNILGTEWDSEAQSPSLEQLNETQLAAAGIAVLPKTSVGPALDSAAGWPAKIEGLTVLDGKTIAIANDNDFGVGTFAGPECTLQDTGTPSVIRVIRLDHPIK